MRTIQPTSNPARSNRPVIPDAKRMRACGGWLPKAFGVLLALLCAQAHGQGDASATKPPPDTSNPTDNTAALPSPRVPANELWLAAHGNRQRLLDRGDADVLLVGDSITAAWPPELLRKFFGEARVINLGHPADRTQHILWRLENHDLGNVSPKLAIVMAGTNNSNGDDWTAEQIAGGVRAIVGTLRAKLPRTKVLLLGIFPRGDRDQRRQLRSGLKEAAMNPQWEKINRVNEMLRSFADGTDVVHLDINKAFLNDKGALPVSLMPDLLHPNEQGYEAWGKAMMPTVAAMMGDAAVRTKEAARRTFEHASGGGWQEVVSDPGTGDWRKQWFLDGEVGTVTNSPEGMTLTAGPEFKNDAHHLVLWTKREFEGDLKIEYDYTRTDEAPNCVTILYIQATGSGDAPYAKDITKWNGLRKVGVGSGFRSRTADPPDLGKDRFHAHDHFAHGCLVNFRDGQVVDLADEGSQQLQQRFVYVGFRRERLNIDSPSSLDQLPASYERFHRFSCLDQLDKVVQD